MSGILRRFIFRFTAGTPADEPVPTKMSELLKKLEERMELVDAGDSFSLNLGAAEPSPANSDKPWFREDTSGRPLGLAAKWQGTWYFMQPPVGGQIYFYGSVSDISKPWYLADGNNGTTNRTGDFPAGGYIIEWRGF